MSDQLDHLRGALKLAAEKAPLATQLQKLGYRIELKASQSTLFSDGHAAMPEPNIVISANSSTWLETLGQYPRPGYQSLGALYRLQPDVKVNAKPIEFMQALPILEDLIESARDALS
jgi:hypothetical protein